MKWFKIIFLIGTVGLSQKLQKKVDFIEGDIDIKIQPKEKLVIGKVSYLFKILQPLDSFYVDAKKMQIKSVQLNDNNVKYSYKEDKLWIYTFFKKTKKYTIVINYQASPNKAMYFIGWDSKTAKKQIWTQGQGKSNANWVPSFDDYNEKVIFKIMVTFQKPYLVISNGSLTKKESVNNNAMQWTYTMRNPMSSYLLAIVIGEYKFHRTLSKSKTPLEFYYYPEDKVKLKYMYRYASVIFDFLEEKIQVDYPWQVYRQVPVRDFLHSGMENTTLMIFDDSYMNDSIAGNDYNYLEVSAHELAHQWFGNLITQTSTDHHWLQEGFATYYALLVVRVFEGEEAYAWALFKLLNKLSSVTSEVLVKKGSSGTTYYKKGALVLYLLKNKIGEKLFDDSVKKYLRKYAFKNVQTTDFMYFIEKININMAKSFSDKWLYGKYFDRIEVERELCKLPLLKKWIELIKKVKFSAKEELPINEKERYIYLLKILNDETLINSIDWIKVFFESRDIVTKKLALFYIKEIPLDLLLKFEKILTGNNYSLAMLMLKKLINCYPEKISYYIQKTDNYGSNSYKVNRLKVMLKVSVFDKEKVVEALENYTIPENSYHLRQQAIQILIDNNHISNSCLKNLMMLCSHHYYRVREWAIKQIKNLSKELTVRTKMNVIFEELENEYKLFFKINYKF